MIKHLFVLYWRCRISYGWFASFPLRRQQTPVDSMFCRGFLLRIYLILFCAMTLYHRLIDEIYWINLQNGIPACMARQSARDAVRFISEQAGGRNIKLSHPDDIDKYDARMKRNQAIIDEYQKAMKYCVIKGEKARISDNIMRRHNISRATFYRILQGNNEGDRDEHS